MIVSKILLKPSQMSQSSPFSKQLAAHFHWLNWRIRCCSSAAHFQAVSKMSCLPCLLFTRADTVLFPFFLSSGISSLLARGVYDSAFPLHDVSTTEKLTTLQLLKVLPNMGGRCNAVGLVQRACVCVCFRARSQGEDGKIKGTTDRWVERNDDELSLVFSH